MISQCGHYLMSTIWLLVKTDAHLSSPTILNVELLLEAEHVIPKSFYFQRLKKDYSGSHSQCSIPVLVVVDVSQNPHGSWWIDKIRNRGVFYDLSNQGLWSREQIKVSEIPNSWNHSVLHFCAIRPVVNIRIRQLNYFLCVINPFEFLPTNP